MRISDTKNEYTDRIHLMRDKWSVEIYNLTARVRQAGAQARAEYHMQIEALYRKKDKARNKLTALENSSEKGWEGMKLEIKDSRENMGNSMSITKLKIKKGKWLYQDSLVLAVILFTVLLSIAPAIHASTI